MSRLSRWLRPLWSKFFRPGRMLAGVLDDRLTAAPPRGPAHSHPPAATHRPELFVLEDRTMLGDAALGPLLSACCLLPTRDPVGPVEGWLGAPNPDRSTPPENVQVFHSPAQVATGSELPLAADPVDALQPVGPVFVSAASGATTLRSDDIVAAAVAAAPDAEHASAPSAEPDQSPADRLPGDPVDLFDPLAMGSSHAGSDAGPFRGHVSDSPGGSAGGSGAAAAPTAAPGPGDAAYGTLPAPTAAATGAPSLPLSGPAPAVAPKTAAVQPTLSALGQSPAPLPLATAIANVDPMGVSPAASGTKPAPASPAQPAPVLVPSSTPAHPLTQNLSFLDPTFTASETGQEWLEPIFPSNDRFPSGHKPTNADSMTFFTKSVLGTVVLGVSPGFLLDQTHDAG